jgi:monofunctional biosynthetic peptidoglycan transglycosylase
VSAVSLRFLRRLEERLSRLIDGRPLDTDAAVTLGRPLLYTYYDAELRECLPVHLAELPRHVVDAVLAAEDAHFFRHSGVAPLGIARAAWQDLRAREVRQGGSTITQQLVKNLFGCTCRNPVRKVYDLALALPAHLILGRERVLELYINTVEWGPGVFGADAAARHHFGRRARDLSRSQSASLAALLPNPIRRTPRNTGEYRDDILTKMESRGW